MLECLYNVHFHLSISGEDVRLMLWDTAGQEEFDAITKAYYRGEFFFFFFVSIFFFFLFAVEFHLQIFAYRHMKKWVCYFHFLSEI